MAALRKRVEALSAACVDVAVLSEAHVGAVDDRLRARPPGPGRLLMCVNHGAELFEVGPDGPWLVRRRELAFPNGSAPEIVEHGRTAYLCKDEDEMVAAIQTVDEIKRADCRSAAEQRLSLARMVRDHERLYHRLSEERDPKLDDQPRVGEQSLSA